MVWCGGCYAYQLNGILPKGETEVEGDREGETEIRYEAGRNGYHILIHLQCDIFHFRNIKARS